MSDEPTGDYACPAGFRQIGWLAEDFCESSTYCDADEAFEMFIEGDFIDVNPIAFYEPGTLVHHSHGPVCKVIPVLIPWPSGENERAVVSVPTQERETT